MISFLAFVYVDNRYYCEMQLSQAIKLKQEIQDIKYESLTISAQLMAVSRQSNIRAMVREKCIDLRGSNVPPVVIYVKKLEE
ncbi:MAG: hypothetical protein AUK44_00335 [Porphyromonadaceae bacterium CG2_30_38_12]|nr:MAG: hypothetical protein AUK44_00335 [Porphyromonadaceae bacterium CG2_30_38_12]